MRLSRFLCAAFLLRVCALCVPAAEPPARIDIVPNPLFSEHAVLQQSREIPVWGTAKDGERVTVEIAGQKAATVAKDGRWLVRLPAVPAGGPYAMTVSGDAGAVTISDVLVGEVWVCSGQSNMERQLGLREGQKPIVDWEQEVAAANHPQVRQFYVPQEPSLTPTTSVAGHWVVCSPATVVDFTAIGYFFGRDLLQARHVPIGLIHSSWGGTPAESWTSLDALRKLSDFAGPVAEAEHAIKEIKNGSYDYAKAVGIWLRAHDAGSTERSPWSAPRLDTNAWRKMELPVFWEKAGLPDFDGVVWFRKSFDLPDSWVGADVELHLGAIDDADTTWINGVEVGATNGWKIARVYRIPAATLHSGRNVIAVRVLDTGGGGGLYGGDDSLRLAPTGGRDLPPISLAGAWLYRASVDLGSVPRPPADYTSSPMVLGALYNGMIVPLQPYAIRGVIWYQGEANVGREKQYRTLFPTMIANWRRDWGEGDFPFLFVQIAPFRGLTPEIREAQLLTWQRTPYTAMAVTIDCGDAEDIHPAHKQPVGARLALAARALAYGEPVEYGPLTGFTVAGADKVFHPAVAEIKDDTVVISSPEVPQPAAVRYAWANVPEGNLYNAAGLPASPFRTDVD